MLSPKKECESPMCSPEAPTNPVHCANSGNLYSASAKICHFGLPGSDSPLRLAATPKILGAMKSDVTLVSTYEADAVMMSPAVARHDSSISAPLTRDFGTETSVGISPKGATKT